MFAAKYGRPLLKTELELLDFYIYFAESKLLKKRKEKPVAPKTISEEQRKQEAIWEVGIERAVKMFGGGICKIFLKAVQEHDAGKIIEIANAVLFFKGKFDPGFIHADPERNALLLIKDNLQRHKQKFTIRQVAELLARGKVKTPADGFSALRRKCRELNVPIAPSRKISKK